MEYIYIIIALFIVSYCIAVIVGHYENKKNKLEYEILRLSSEKEYLEETVKIQKSFIVNLTKENSELKRKYESSEIYKRIKGIK